jgi:hypothetical protein
MAEAFKKDTYLDTAPFKLKLHIREVLLLKRKFNQKFLSYNII